MMKNRRQCLFSTIIICVIYLKDYSTGNKVFGKFGSVRVFLDPSDIPVTNQWGSSWPEGIKLDENFQSSFATPRIFQDGTLLPAAQQYPRRIAPVRRTYNWQAEELVISFNMSNVANPTCTRLEPPITWLELSGAKVKVLPSLPASEECASPKLSSSLIEVSVSRKFAENSLTTLRSKGFTREDIYRMLDKGPWALAFDIPSALPRLFASLQNDIGLSQSQAVHIVSHCPYLIAQYARCEGRDIFATATALMDVGYTLPKLVTDVMRFPSMLAAPPDRIRGWMSLLVGFGVAENPALFGKMLKRAPFMLYVDPPKITDGLPSERPEISGSTSEYVAYEALDVLRLLKAQGFPDLDKIVRTQPSILLVDSCEVSARADFLFHLFLENLPSSSSSAPAYSSGPFRGSSSRYSQGDVDLYGPVKRDRMNRVPAQSEQSILETNSRLSNITKSSVRLLELENNSGTAYGDRSAPLASSSKRADSSLMSSDSSKRVAGFQTALASHRGNADTDAVASSVVDRSRSARYTAAPMAIGDVAYAQDASLSSDSASANKDIAHEMLGALLLSYPAVLSIEHRQMRAAGNALRTAGLTRREVLLIARRHPPVLGRDPNLLVNLVSFLRFTCGLRKADLLPFLYRYPAVLGAEVKDIEPKVEYLFQSLGGSQEMLRRFPSFLSFDLEEHTRPRAEFLRALKIDPLLNGLAFLVSAPSKEIAYTAGVRVELFNQFHSAYSEMRKKKKLQEKELSKCAANAIGRDAKQKALQFSSWIAQNVSPEDTLLDELDVSF